MKSEYKHIAKESSYDLLLKSGMFWVIHPELTGDWNKDKLTINDEIMKEFLTLDTVGKVHYLRHNIGLIESSNCPTWLTALDLALYYRDRSILLRFEHVLGDTYDDLVIYYNTFE